MTSFWLAWRYLGSWRRFFNLSISLSVLGLAMGVGSLIVSMAVFSGYQTTLETSIQDAFGHVLVMKRGSGEQSEILRTLESEVPGLIAKTPFVYAEAIVAHKGKVNGVLIEGVDESTVHSVLNLEHRLGPGYKKLGRDDDGPTRIWIGKNLATKFGVAVGDILPIVVPLSPEFQSTAFRPKLGKFEVAGIINFGRHDIDSRYIMMGLRRAQEFAEVGDRVTGYRLKIEDPSRARAIAENIGAKFSGVYWARDWQDMNRNLFEAARLEKAILFVVLLVLVIAAAFNVANTLFISVVQKYRDISVLKALGATDNMVSRLFTFQGLIVGAVGSGAGVGLGLLLCRVFEWAQVRWQLIPPEVYKLDHIELQVRAMDLMGIVGVSLLICLVATVVPSRRSRSISPVDGLRYE